MKINIKSFIFILMPFLFYNCGDNDSDYIDPRGNTYAGSVSCMDCHQKVYDDVLTSSHDKASAPATIKNILGNFSPGHNTYMYDKDTKIVMENRKNELFQVYYKNGKEVKAYRFDIVMGAKNAQTFLFWDNDNIGELPLSYYKYVNDWGTSPSYPPNKPDFGRMISKECFECHSSNIELKNKNVESENYFGTEINPESMKKESLVYGIDCERCHGPAMDHVKYHKRNPELKIAKYITTNKSLNNQQKLARCVICHYAEENLQSRFKFKPGNSLADFYRESNPYSNFNNDVHGNQYGLLSQSKCFIESKTMDCISCHNPHKEEQNDLSNYSKKCISCHSEAKNNIVHDKVSNKNVHIENCIDCHMPKTASEVIGYFLSGNSEMFPYLLRTHKIGIYPKVFKENISKK